MEFKSQISTTIEQSKRLLELGVKPETADMYYSNAGIPAFSNGEYTLYAKSYAEVMEKLNNQISPFDFIPAWSAHRLLELLTGMEWAVSAWNIDTFKCGVWREDSSYSFTEYGGFYDCVISCVDFLIEKELFNKEYLKE